MNKFLILTLCTIFFSVYVHTETRPVFRFLFKRQASNSSFVGGAAGSGAGLAVGNASGSSNAPNVSGSANLVVGSSGNASVGSFEVTSGSDESQGTFATGAGLGSGTGSATGGNASVIIDTSGTGNGTGGHQSISSEVAATTPSTTSTSTTSTTPSTTSTTTSTTPSTTSTTTSTTPSTTSTSTTTTTTTSTTTTTPAPSRLAEDDDDPTNTMWA